jgi:Ca-activated chloride channel family protein
MHPLWFAALPLALLPWLEWLRPFALRFSSVSSVVGGRGPRWLLSVVPAALQSACLVATVLALARPQAVLRESLTEREGIDIMLAMDTSGSMDEGDMGGTGRPLTRLEAGKLVMKQFVASRPDDRVGLLPFGQEAFVQVPLTLDHQGLGDFIDMLEIGIAGKNQTAVGTAIAVACKRMKELTAPSKVVILVTDGRSNAGSVEPIEAAKAAKALGIRVYTIGVGSADGGGRGLLRMIGGGGADVDEPTLRAVAATTGATYHRATDAEALRAVYADIDRMEPSTARVKEFVHREELYLRLLLPALAFFALHLLLSTTLLRRLP